MKSPLARRLGRLEEASGITSLTLDDLIRAAHGDPGALECLRLAEEAYLAGRLRGQALVNYRVLVETIDRCHRDEAVTRIVLTQIGDDAPAVD